MVRIGFLFLIFLTAQTTVAQTRSDFASVYIGNSFGSFETRSSFGNDHVTLRNRISPSLGYEHSLRLFNNFYLNGGLELTLSRTSIWFDVNDSLLQMSEKFTESQVNVKMPFVFSYRLKILPQLVVVPAAGLILMAAEESSSSFGVFSGDQGTNYEHFEAELSNEAMATFKPMLRLGLEYRFTEKVGVALGYRYIGGSDPFYPDASGHYRYLFKGSTTSAGSFSINRDVHTLMLSLVLKR